MQTQFTCPSTGANLAFDIPSDEDTITRMWQEALHIHCPVCEDLHETGYKQVYLTGLMDQFQCLPADVKEARVH